MRLVRHPKGWDPRNELHVPILNQNYPLENGPDRYLKLEFCTLTQHISGQWPQRWGGNQIVTLGTEAFKWFAPYGPKEKLEEFWQRGDRYEAQLPITLEAVDFQGTKHQRQVSLLPLPHPSPLNKRYYAKFPQMLQQRINKFEF